MLDLVAALVNWKRLVGPDVLGIHPGVVRCHYAAALVRMLRLAGLVKFEILLGFVGLRYIVSDVVDVDKISG